MISTKYLKKRYFIDIFRYLIQAYVSTFGQKEYFLDIFFRYFLDIKKFKIWHLLDI